MKEFITKAKNEYMEIGKVFCPYFDDYVQMTKKGFDHLIYTKKTGKRRYPEVFARFKSIKKIPEILSKSGTLQEYRDVESNYFGFIAIIDSKKYKVVVLKTNKNTYKFVSIIPKWKTGLKNKIKTPTPNGIDV